MKKRELARRMARRDGVSEGEAADRLDLLVREILIRVRRGEDAGLPGLGRFVQNRDGSVGFKPERKR